jgi:myo-inositol-1(or 4)-monophosphatase
LAVNIALADSQLYPPLLGVMYDPMRDECFAAIRGEGATLNGKSLKVSGTPKLAQSVIASGFPYTKWTDPDNNADRWGNFVVRSRGVRRMGAAGLDMAYVAAGRFDGYWEHHLSAWDIMPSIICLLEAGGRLSNYAGEPLDPYQIVKLRVVASNGYIHDEMLTVLREGNNAPRPV